MTLPPATPDQKRKFWALAFTVGFILLAALQIFLIYVRLSNNFSLGKHPVTVAWCCIAVPYTLLAGVAVVMALFTRIAQSGNTAPLTRRLLKLALWITPVTMALAYFMWRETEYWGGHMVQLSLLVDEVQGFVIPAIMAFYCIYWLFVLRRARFGESIP